MILIEAELKSARESFSFGLNYEIKKYFEIKPLMVSRDNVFGFKRGEISIAFTREKNCVSFTFGFDGTPYAIFSVASKKEFTSLIKSSFGHILEELHDRIQRCSKPGQLEVFYEIDILESHEGIGAQIFMSLAEAHFPTNWLLLLPD